MPTTKLDPVSAVRAAVQRWRERLGPGLTGLACSGGPDSLALADAAIAELGAANVIVMHVDHQLAAESARVADDVARWASAQGVVAVVRRVEVAQRASLEAAARAARYAALEAIATEVGASSIWLAHTARDQAETVLMRIVRGTGPAGLAGIPAQRGRFVRPLLELPRETIDAYIAERRLPRWIDPMNHDQRFARVRFREHVLPALRAENRLLDDALRRLAGSAREWLAVIDRLAAPIARFPIDAAALAAIAEPAVRKRGYALALEAAGLSYDAVHLDAIDQIAGRAGEGALAVDVPGGRVVRSYAALDLERAIEPDALEPPPGHELRVWRPGDRMKPARLKGRSRKLSDLFIDAKVPRAVRRRARVVVRCADQVIVWAEHVGLAFGESPGVVPRSI